jgi:hypothetical protein
MHGPSLVWREHTLELTTRNGPTGTRVAGHHRVGLAPSDRPMNVPCARGVSPGLGHLLSPCRADGFVGRVLQSEHAADEFSPRMA